MTRQEKVARAIAGVVAEKHLLAHPQIAKMATMQELADKMWPDLMQEAEAVCEALKS